MTGLAQMVNESAEMDAISVQAHMGYVPTPVIAMIARGTWAQHPAKSSPDLRNASALRLQHFVSKAGNSQQERLEKERTLQLLQGEAGVHMVKASVALPSITNITLSGAVSSTCTVLALLDKVSHPSPDHQLHAHPSHSHPD